MFEPLDNRKGTINWKDGDLRSWGGYTAYNDKINS